MKRLTAVLALLVVSCGGASEGGTETVVSSTVEESATPAVAAPRDSGTLLDALAAMPAELAGATRTGSSAGEARYRTNTADFGIEASEIEDAYGPGVSVDEAVDLLQEDLVDPRSCDSGEVWCLEGGVGDGGVVMVWGHRESNLMLAAVAPDAATLEELLMAWQDVAG